MSRVTLLLAVLIFPTAVFGQDWPTGTLVAAQAEIAIHTTGLAGGPAAVAQAHLGAVAGQTLDLAVDLQALHVLEYATGHDLHRLVVAGEIPPLW